MLATWKSVLEPCELTELCCPLRAKALSLRIDRATPSRTWDSPALGRGSLGHSRLAVGARGGQTQTPVISTLSNRKLDSVCTWWASSYLHPRPWAHWCRVVGKGPPAVTGITFDGASSAPCLACVSLQAKALGLWAGEHALPGVGASSVNRHTSQLVSPGMMCGRY